VQLKTISKDTESLQNAIYVIVVLKTYYEIKLI